ncbi:MAG: SusC/RagA family TonB-linked outer membrane protein [Bacteroidales bacterium]|nr:SusC/RagA family TonB-linked outer membrane protein [Bacteroidales bacterium]
MCKRKVMLLLMLLLFAWTGVKAQEKTVTGKVIDEDGQPIFGATISLKGSTVGTISGDEGKYTIKIPATIKGDTLIFSFIGMEEQRQAIGNRSTIDVIMKSSNIEVDEVVVTAMGISREKKSLGYAVQEVNSDDITQASNSNIATALQGKVSGLEITPSSGMPGASAKMTIRGSRSFTGNNTPLYVIDGMPIASSFDLDTYDSVTGSDYSNRSLDIDPNDIESINVLKGQAAAALYGMKASNGVIVITTKSGKNAKAGRAIVTVNTSTSFDKISVFPDLQKKYAQGTGGNYSPNSSMSWGPIISELANDPNYGGNVENQFTAEEGLHQGQYYVDQRAKAGLNPWAYPQAYNSAENYFDTGISNTNSVNVTQNTGNANYSLSFGNTYTKGIIPSTELKKYNVKLNASTKLGEHFESGFSGNYVTSNMNKQTGANNGLIATILPCPPSYDLEGIPNHEANNPYTQVNYRSTSSFDNAYWATENNLFSEESQRFFGNAYLKFDTKLSGSQNLVVKYQIGTDAYTTNYIDNWGYGHSNSNGEIENQELTERELNSLFTTQYTWNINSDFRLDVLVGNEIVHHHETYNDSHGYGYNFEGWNNMSNIKTYTAASGYSKRRSVGFFGNIELSYSNMIYLTLTGRNDKVSNMPRNNRSFFYPSASLGFVFTQIEALKDNPILSFGKIRLSYAEVGQAGDYIPTFLSTPAYGGGFSSGTPIMYPINSVVAYTPYYRVYDPELKPQNTKSYEIGTDLSFLNGRFGLEFTYSRQNSKDQIFDIPLSGSTGVSEFRTNGGKIHTNAYELTVNLKPIDFNNIKWNLSFNYSKIDNIVDELAEGVESIMLGGFVEPQVRASAGDSYPVIYGTSYARADNGKIIVNEDGLPELGEEKVLGKVTPDFTLSCNTSLDIYKARLKATFEYSKGGYMYYATPGMLNVYGVSKESEELRERSTFMFENAVKFDEETNSYVDNDILLGPDGNGVTAEDYYNYLSEISESNIRDKSFLKLREISLSYPIFNKKNISINASIYARNILIWSKIKGFDPEVSQGNNNMSGAFERFSLPNAKSFGFSFNFIF